MNKCQIHYQEQKCLRAKVLIDMLLTELYGIDDFRYYKTWKYKLYGLKKQLNDIYWDL